MLSRIAESLFWIGRYVERADDTARILKTHLRVLVEDASGAEVDACRNLLALMSVDHVENPVADDLLRVLGYDRSEPTSIVASWAAARDNARRAREVIPLDLWECINTTWQQLPTGPLRVASANTFLDWARERSALFAGIARGTMVRDDGWQFLLLGRSIEQADMTSRMVASAALSSGATPWPSVLRGCGGHDAFLRTYRGLHTDRGAAQFLILDDRFPRSIMHGLMAASACLEMVAQANPSALRQAGEALRRLGQVRARLEYSPLDDLLKSLDSEMTEVQDACAYVTSTVSTTFFAAADPTAWITEGTR
ncbi:MAG: alpha-E domain-containing protein [Propionibacteriaceae bacterium]|nr:alpha-E domain-containing protein [Propionibacteriaceae bacterium]